MCFFLLVFKINLDVQVHHKMIYFYFYFFKHNFSRKSSQKSFPLEASRSRNEIITTSIAPGPVLFPLPTCRPDCMLVDRHAESSPGQRMSSCFTRNTQGWAVASWLSTMGRWRQQDVPWDHGLWGLIKSSEKLSSLFPPFPIQILKQILKRSQITGKTC